MNILLDANLSWRLVNVLKNHFKTVQHVDQILVPPATDLDIWHYAKKNSYLIITNDEDFHQLLQQFGFPPKIVLLKLGNQSTNYLSLLLTNKKNEIEKFSDQNEYGLLEIL